ncbi:hypothetical protein GCM10011512_06700 [Tersicoccus solisilvae]|uniref:DUF948 domain-containing protein n=1 Tax=Tersicoccus solisilvae TaxID=1882339 RepID=A0ABQ1NTW3_9MICC|nr:DUF948 domain-containing protein [Tersicoccus solisilvae]GGC82608.1 hypothetical protein GCM10011512_06700 [Tersicoccus solisilvae]
MSGGDIAGLIAAGVFAVLVILLAVPILKLGAVFDEARRAIRGVSDETTPLLQEVTGTVATTHEQLRRVDDISRHLAATAASLSSLSASVTALIGTPLGRLAAVAQRLTTPARTPTTRRTARRP